MWVAVIVGAVGCYLCKLLGLSVPERVLEHPRADRIADLLPVALLAALVAVQTFADGKELAIDARLAGLVVAIVAIWRRAPFLLVVFLAAVTTAALRAI